MPETLISPISIATPAKFDDDAIAAIINTLAVAGDQPIARLAGYIRDLRKNVIPLESQLCRLGRDQFDDALCCNLYEELMRRGAIDGFGALRLDRLRVQFK